MCSMSPARSSRRASSTCIRTTTRSCCRHRRCCRRSARASPPSSSATAASASRRWCTASVPPPLNLLGGGDKYIYPTMASYVAAVDAARPAVNVAALVGHSTLRVADNGRSLSRGHGAPSRIAHGARCCAKAWTPARSACPPACSTRPALPPTSTSWRCSPASPAMLAASTRPISARRWTRCSTRSTRRLPRRAAATCRS